MNKPTLQLMPGDEEKLEADLEKQLQGLKVEEPGQPMSYPEEKKDSPDLSVANESPHRDLIQRSHASFTNHIAQLDARIADVNQAIERAIEAKNAEIAKLEEKHRKFLHAAEKDLYQIKTLKGAVELAMVALGMDEE